MNTVCISGDERKMDDPDEQWIAQEISSRRRAGQLVWVLVRVETPWGGVLLRSSQCPPERGRAGYRPPMPLERDILELWDKLGLCNGDLSPGNLIAFLKQARRLVER